MGVVAAYAVQRVVTTFYAVKDGTVFAQQPTIELIEIFARCDWSSAQADSIWPRARAKLAFGICPLACRLWVMLSQVIACVSSRYATICFGYHALP